LNEWLFKRPTSVHKFTMMVSPTLKNSLSVREHVRQKNLAAWM